MSFIHIFEITQKMDPESEVEVVKAPSAVPQILDKFACLILYPS